MSRPKSLALRALPYLALPAVAVASALFLMPAAAKEGIPLPAPAMDAPSSASTETAVLAGGCFWGVQAVFAHVKGVKQVLEGYAGGSVAGPSYEQVSTGSTGHAESVEIKFDPREISYGKLLQVFFSVAHDPTQLNRQGPDTGTQYRSAIFYANETQQKVAKAYIAQLEAADLFGGDIVTQIAPMESFYVAEDYHQDYYFNHPESLYIQFNDVPKVRNLERLFPDLYREKPVRVAEAS